MSTPQEKRRATLIGAVAIVLWSALALFTTATGAVPPFQLLAMTFTIAFLLALVFWYRRWRRAGRQGLSFLRQPWPVWALGIGGLFGYHAFYFLALDHAPAVDASLIAYLWPLLIVLFSALLPGEHLRWHHVAGGVVGLVGAFLLIAGRGGGVMLKSDYALGYAAALACAFTWSSYSLLSRRYGKVPTDLVGAFCGITALLGIFAHLLFEETVWPADFGEWLAVAALGLGPVGLAFFVWDHGVKKGDIQALGAFSYAAPLISTLLLILFGRAALTPAVAISCLLIVGGAVLAARDLFFRRRPAPLSAR